MAELPQLLLEIFLVYICFFIYSLTPRTFRVTINRLLDASKRSIINFPGSKCFCKTLCVSSVFEQLIP